MNLYEQTLEAVDKFDTYRYPDLYSWTSTIDEVLRELHQATIGGDSIESLYLDDDDLSIRTEYTVRSCECSNSMCVPIHILKAEDPVKAARLYYLEGEYKRAQSRVKSAQAELEHANEYLNKTEQLYKGAM